MECSIIHPALSLLMKHLVIGQHQTAPNFSAFYWSPHSSLVSIGQHFVTVNINTEIEMEVDLNTESADQAVRAVHSCSSWFSYIFSFMKKTKSCHENFPFCYICFLIYF